jgi:tetratricopeptide (TPR) repeat protein
MSTAEEVRTWLEMSAALCALGVRRLPQQNDTICSTSVWSLCPSQGAHGGVDRCCVVACVVCCAQLKALGNAAQQAGKYDEAIDFYTQAIALDASNHVYYSNRSAAYLSKGDADNALVDAEKCIEVSRRTSCSKFWILDIEDRRTMSVVV